MHNKNSISGQQVPEISQTELAPLKIRKPLTDYVSNGTDQSLAKLANGAYLYRLQMSNFQKRMPEKYELSAHKNNYFDGDEGKLSIIR